MDTQSQTEANLTRIAILENETVVHHTHEWDETYYGWQCQGCSLFYPFGSAPWEDQEDLGSESGDLMDDLWDDSDFYDKDR